VPDALGSGVGSLLADEVLAVVGPEIAVGRSACPCETLPWANCRDRMLEDQLSLIMVSRTTE